jgi:hypothetical protein
MKLYNSVNGIQTYLTDLAGINRLAADRHKAYYERKEPLEKFCILGRWITDSCGNFGLIIGNERMGDKIPAEMGTCPPVMNERDHQLFMRGGNISWSGSGWPFPPAYATCVGCRDKWRLDNCHDFQSIQGHEEASLEEWVGQPLSSITEIPSLKDKLWHVVSQDSVYSDVYEGESKSGTSGVKWHRVERDHVIQPGDRAMLQIMRFAHKECHRIQVEKEERNRMEDVFAKAGYSKVNLITRKNAYCPCDVCPPWYLAQVDNITPITIGWRKRVINIDWEESGKDLAGLFTSEDVTKGSGYIHAWGYDKAAEYLSKILPALGAGR